MFAHKKLGANLSGAKDFIVAFFAARRKKSKVDLVAAMREKKLLQDYTEENFGRFADFQFIHFGYTDI